MFMDFRTTSMTARWPLRLRTMTFGATFTTCGQAPAPLASQITKAYSKSDGTYSMMPFFDLLAVHEMGHSYTAQAGLKMQRHWMSELFVNIMLHTYVAEEQPGLLPAFRQFSENGSEWKFARI
jgi:hypothetical protein